MIMLNEKLIREIVDNTNYKNVESVKESITTGDVEIYTNQEEYEKVGYDLRFERYYTILSNGTIAHFIGG